MTELPSSLKNIELLVLDMDGVITSEHAYWDTAGLVVRDLLDSPVFLGLYPPDYTPIADIFYQRVNRGPRHDWRKYLPIELIRRCKSRGINSNWDLAYLVAGLYIAPLFSPFSQLRNALLNESPPIVAGEGLAEDAQEDILFHNRMHDHLTPVWNKLRNIGLKQDWPNFLHLRDFHLWGSWFRERKCTIAPVNKIELRIIDDFHPDVRGIRLLDELNKLLDEDATDPIQLFGRKTPLWEECRDLFQQWYLGEELYQKVYESPIPYAPKPGLIHNEEPLNGKDKTLAALSKLRDAGYRLAIATGRPRMEIITPLSEWNALQYFEEDRIATHDEVESAEKELLDRGIHDNVGKPHPYVFMKAIHPEKNTMDIFNQCNSPLRDRDKILIVGDAMADIWAAKKIDCPCAALLSGAMGESGRRDIEAAHPEIVCKDFIELTEILLKKDRSE